MKKFILLLFMFSIISTVCFAKVNVPETVRIMLNDGSIVELDLDEYLYGVVESEMGIRYKVDGKVNDIDIEALKAQAVASRTYAVHKIQANKESDYDMTATTKDQVYKGGDAAEIVKEAVDATSGQVITYDDEVICAYFFSTSGGHTEAPEYVWSSEVPYLKGVEDPYEPYIDGRSEWEARISADKYGSIKILERDENDRVVALKVGKQTLYKNNIRMTLGTSLIKSTWFELEYDDKTDEYVFCGRGYGHGVGMSQNGAIGMAESGFDYEEILKWYYTDIELEPDFEEKDKDGNKKDEYEEDNDEKSVDKDYSNSSIELKGDEEEEVKRGPLFMTLLSIISNPGFIFGIEI